MLTSTTWPAEPTQLSVVELPSVPKGRDLSVKAASGTTPTAGGNRSRTSDPMTPLAGHANRLGTSSLASRILPRPSNTSTASLVSERSPAKAPVTDPSPMPSMRLFCSPPPAIAAPLMKKTAGTWPTVPMVPVSKGR